MHFSKEDVKREKMFTRLENDKILNQMQVTPGDLLGRGENGTTSITVIPQVPRTNNLSKTIADDNTQGTQGVKSPASVMDYTI